MTGPAARPAGDRSLANGFSLSAHLGYLFTELPFEARFAAAAAAGFAFVEHPSPYAVSSDRVRALCEGNGLSVTQIGTPAGTPGEKGIAALVGREAEFAVTVEEAVRYARAIACPLIHPMSGVPSAHVSEDRTWACYRANIGSACEAAASHGLGVIIEPIGPGSLPGYYMNHPDLAMRVLDAVEAPNLWLSFDVFHAAQAGVDPVEFTTRYGHRFAHVQVADAPGRHEPGTGTIDFASFFDALEDVGYAGPIGLEYIPARSTVEGIGWPSGYPALAPLVNRTSVPMGRAR
ncbi:hydroxypyruvate isomerase family protein [Sphingomonas bacterium]|uniref:hydroxypyruvate isomerase family protein n=1 Tax=Sphingomonas bacterium TaxID=1895847 RepID=UPI0015771D06|nr:TIM barrel protein [Sphingomonas bacterium]